MSDTRVMLLIDADNVSTDIIEQACARLHSEYGALHVRRAYCTAESAVKHQNFFKRLSIKPMVNLAAGKNSTDIALAVDALDLVLAERPDVVVIASSDSDFAPLVSRLREKGCLVRGVGQQGKVGEETPLIYDDFLQFEHRSGKRTLATDAAAEPTRKSRTTRTTRTTGGSRKTAASGRSVDTEVAPKAKAEVGKTSSRRRKTSQGEGDDAPAAEPPAAEPAAAAAPAAPAKRSRSRKSSAESAAAPAPAEPSDTPPPPAAAAKKTRSRKSSAKAASDAAPAESAAPASTAVQAPAEVAELLNALPGLAPGRPLALQQVSEQLRRAGLLSKRNTSRKLLSRWPQWFELQPEDDPVRVILRTPA